MKRIHITASHNVSAICVRWPEALAYARYLNATGRTNITFRLVD